MRSNATSRRAMTLLELILVLGLLFMVAAVAAPSVGLTLDSHRLRSGAELVRSRLAKARIKAMESGQTYAFLYQPGSDGFLIQRWHSQDDYLESSARDAASLTPPGVNPAALAAPPAGGVANGTLEQLPEGIVFVGGEMTGDQRALMMLQMSPSAQPPALEGEWSQPIFFYPDGTSSTARLVITNPRQRSVTLTLRGLTGVVRVSRPVAADESAR